MSINLNIDKRRKIYNVEHDNKLSFWDLVFWQNMSVRFFEKDFDQILKQVITQSFEIFAKPIENPKYFRMDLKNSPEFAKYLSYMAQRFDKFGDYEMADSMRKNPDHFLEIMSCDLEDQHSIEFMKLFIRLDKYDKSFKFLMLNEYLSSLYKNISVDEKTLLKVEKRDVKQSIFGLMHMPTFVLDYIYENGSKYIDFKDLYFDAQAKNRKIIQNLFDQKALDSVKMKNPICNLKTPKSDKGRWIKFPCLQEDAENFERNVELMQTLLQDCPSCLSYLGERYLREGPVYVFVDNNLKPHISVDTDMEKVWEFEGNLRGHVLEKKYFDVAKEFFEANKQIEGMDICLEYLRGIEILSDGLDKMKDGSLKKEEKSILKKVAYKYDSDFVDGKLYYVEELKKMDPSICEISSKEKKEITKIGQTFATFGE